MKIIKLGTITKDKATGLKGMVTHLFIRLGGQRTYMFQPKGLHKKTGQPLEVLWLTAERLNSPEDHIVSLPDQVLGTMVEDVASGFAGMAINLILHTNGCVHFDVQPNGLQEGGQPVESCNFDVRRLKGKAIKPMTEPKIEADHRRRPSPSPVAGRPQF